MLLQLQNRPLSLPPLLQQPSHNPLNRLIPPRTVHNLLPSLLQTFPQVVHLQHNNIVLVLELAQEEPGGFVGFLERGRRGGYVEEIGEGHGFVCDWAVGEC